MRAALSAAADGLERRGLRAWTLGELPRTVERQQGGRTVRAYPALVDEGAGVAVRLLETEAAQQRAMGQGTRRLLSLQVSSPVRFVLGRLTDAEKMTLSRYPHGSATDLFDDCVACALDGLVADAGGPAWDADGFGRLLARVRAGLDQAALDVVSTVARILAAAGEVEARLAGPAGPTLAPALADAGAQLSGLVYPGFVTATGRRRLPDVLRYVRGIAQRLEKLSDGPGRDTERMLEVQQLERAYRRLLERLAPGQPPGEALGELRWMLEELRVSAFAQTLGTPAPVSAKRIRRALERLAG
jgi:ATP-dependent helicase HrpA